MKTAYGDAVSIHNLDGLHDAIGLDLACNKAELTGAEVRFLRKELDMSQNTLANILGVGETSVRGWEKERTIMPGPASRVLRLIYREHVAGNGTVRGLVERIAELNRKQHRTRYEFEETKNGWKKSA